MIFRGGLQQGQDPNAAYCVTFSPDGARALSGSFDKTLKLWDLSPYLAAR